MNNQDRINKKSETSPDSCLHYKPDPNNNSKMLFQNNSVRTWSNVSGYGKMLFFNSNPYNNDETIVKELEYQRKFCM